MTAKGDRLAEKETLVVFTEVDTEARVYTWREPIWAACERAGGRKIHSGVRNGKEITREYAVNLSQLYRVLNRLGSELQDEAARSAREKIPAELQGAST